jgi:TM2 domain-containing membrane protein YozV
MIEINKRSTPHYPKNYFYALMMCCFLGMFGIHRFYTGYKRIGFIQLITLGGFGIWWLIDLVSVCFNSYKDKYGIEMEEYNGHLAALVLMGIAVALLIVASATMPLLFGNV